VVDGSFEMALDSSVDTSLEQTLPGIDEGEIIVIRSKKRKRNIAAFRQGGKIIISIPARLSKAEEREVVPEMIAKIRAKEVAPAESELMQAADELLSRYAPEISLRPASVTWRAMNERWGSCTSVDRTIRLAKLRGDVKSNKIFLREVYIIHRVESYPGILAGLGSKLHPIPIN